MRESDPGSALSYYLSKIVVKKQQSMLIFSLKH